VRPEELSQWKTPLTPPGIKPPIFLLVVQCLNQLIICLTSFFKSQRHVSEKKYGGTCTEKQLKAALNAVESGEPSYSSRPKL
jgi:hypothetical protein